MIVGKKRKNAPINIWGFGVEIETISNSPDQLILLKKGFTPCYDSSVTIEWKSPIFQSFLGFKGLCKTIETIDVEHGGSHVHVSVVRKDLFKHYYNEIFYPLAEYLNNSDLTSVWGREENEYSELPGKPYERYSWVNVQTNYRTLEWRLPKFMNAEQYYNLVKWLVYVTWAMDTKLRHSSKPCSPKKIGKFLLENYKQMAA